MALRTPDDQESRIDEAYRGGQGAYINAGLDQAEQYANDPANKSASNQSDIKESESNPGNFINYTGVGKKTADSRKLQKGIKIAKKRGGVIGLMALFGVGGGLLAGVFGPASMLINLTENIGINNDTAGTSMSARAGKVFGKITNPRGDDAGICGSTRNAIRCKGTRISNKALRSLERKGVVAYDASPRNGGKPINTRSGKYPARNPAIYVVDLNDGYGQRTITAQDMRGFMANNPKFRSKILGTRGAFNARLMTWAGKHMNRSFYSKYGISKNGGIADGRTGPFANSRDKMRTAKEKINSRIPGLDRLSSSGFNAMMQNKVGDKMSRAKVGGVAYQTAFAGCLVSKAPSLISAGVAGVQLMRLMPLINDMVLSPGHKQKASGLVDPEIAITQEDTDMINSALTNRTENKNGDMKSALDAPALQAAMGVNTNRLSVSELGDFIPGYSVLTSDIMSNLRDTQRAVGPACNVILNPITMYTFLAAESLITKTNPIGAAAGLFASVVVGLAAGPLVSWALEEGGERIITALAENDALEDLEGEDLGNALGVAAMAFYSAGSMSRYVPTLSEAGLVGYREVHNDIAAQEREMDIASLSPFDISSRHTFMGSISHRINSDLISNAGISNVASLIGSVLRIPSVALSPKASADTFLPAYCSYAAEFEMTVDNSDDPDAQTPAINAAGMPCTGISQLQASMDPDTALDLLIEQGWIDEEKEFEDDLTIQELLEADVIKQDSPLGSYVMGCGDASTGDYLFEIQGCVTRESYTAGNVHVNDASAIDEVCSGDEGEDTACISGLESAGQASDETRAHQAMAVWLLDYQISQAINGDDESEDDQTANPSGPRSNSGNLTSEGWAYPVESGNLTTYAGHNGMDMAVPIGTPIYAIRDGTVKRVEYEPLTAVQDRCWQTTPNGGQQNLYIESVIDGVTYTHRYAHLSKFEVEVGDQVRAGDQVALSGNTGCSTGPHLHLDLSTSISHNDCDARMFNRCYVMISRFFGRSW